MKIKNKILGQIGQPHFLPHLTTPQPSPFSFLSFFSVSLSLSPFPHNTCDTFPFLSFFFPSFCHQLTKREREREREREGAGKQGRELPRKGRKREEKKKKKKKKMKEEEKKNRGIRP
jgi:hypothetical protein